MPINISETLAKLPDQRTRDNAKAVMLVKPIQSRVQSLPSKSMFYLFYFSLYDIEIVLDLTYLQGSDSSFLVCMLPTSGLLVFVLCRVKIGFYHLNFSEGSPLPFHSPMNVCLVPSLMLCCGSSLG